MKVSSNNRPWPTRSAKVWDDLSQLKRHKREVRCERGREKQRKQRENNLRSVCDCVRVGVRTDLTQAWGWGEHWENVEGHSLPLKNSRHDRNA